MIKRYLFSILIILTSYSIHYAQAPTNVGWSGSGTAILAYTNSCSNFTNITCLGSGTGSETPFIPGINYTIINDINTAAGCPNPLTNAWIQIWDGDMTTCNSATPIGSPALNDLNVTMTGTGPYFIAVTSMNPAAADNLCGGGKGYDFTGQSATIRYRQETTIINTTSTASICMSEPKDLTYQLVGGHDNPEVEWELISGNGNIVGSTFLATDTVEVTLRVWVGTCYDDITYKPIGSSTAPTSIDGPSEICGNTPFTLEALGGFNAPGSEYQWGTGSVVGVNPIAVTPTPIYSPNPINNSETYWVRRSNNTPGCYNYTLGATIDISVYVDAMEEITETICEGDSYLFGDEVLTQPISNYTKVFETVNTQCDSTVILNLIVEANPIATLPSDTSMCEGDAITLDAGNPGSTYIWNTGQTTQIIDVEDSGIYTVEIDNGICTSVSQVEVSYIEPGSGQSIYNTELGDRLFQFHVVNPINVESYLWDFGDGNSSTEEEPIHQYADYGLYDVFVYFNEDEACDDQGYLMRHIQVRTVGIDDLLASDDYIKLYPNPANNMVSIELDEVLQMNSVMIQDITGRILIERSFDEATSHINLSTQSLATGIYQVVIDTKEGRYIKKLEVIK